MTLDRVDSIIDGLRVKRCGELTFSVVQRFVDEIVTVPDQQVFEALIWIVSYCKLVPEGAAAAPVAALLQNRIDLPRKPKSPASSAATTLTSTNSRDCAGTE